MRYQRQIILKNFGLNGQQRLSDAHVLVIGAGGLGCPVLQYLTAAGVGRIGIVDFDTVSESNLHRQVLYQTAQTGQLKVSCAIAALQALNPEISLEGYPVRLTAGNAAEIVQNYDLVVDATDNFATRYLVNDTCVLLGKTLVFGAISEFDGQIAVFNHPTPQGKPGVHYRHLFPAAPVPGQARNCTEGGVLGVLPGIIGSMMANEVIKILTGIGQPLANQLLTFNALTNSIHTFEFEAGALPDNTMPAHLEALKNWPYEMPAAAPDPADISLETLHQLVLNDGFMVIDIREPGELPESPAWVHHHIPLSQLRQNWSLIPGNKVILVCQSGQRSREAAHRLAATHTTLSLLDGITGAINTTTSL